MTARLEGESKLLAAARDALSLDPTERDVLGPMQAEITDLREVRSAFRLGRALCLLTKHNLLKCLKSAINESSGIVEIEQSIVYGNI